MVHRTDSGARYQWVCALALFLATTSGCSGGSAAASPDNATAAGSASTDDPRTGSGGSGAGDNPDDLPSGAMQGAKIMWLGDSIVEDGRARYLLWNMLHYNGYANIDFVGESDFYTPYEGDFDVDHASWGGREADEVRDLAAASIAQTKPEIALVHLGTNDAFHGKSGAETAQELSSLIDLLRAANPSVHVFIYEFPHPNSVVASSYLPELRTMVESTTTQSSPVSLLKLADIWNADFDTHDDTHPNLQGNIKIARLAFDAVAPLIQRSEAPPAPNPIHEPANIAVGAKASADTYWDGLFSNPSTGPGTTNPDYAAPGNATDGDLFTYWGVNDSETTHSFQVDLGSPQDVTGVSIYWERTGRRWSYTIETSSDGNSWEQAGAANQMLDDTLVATRTDFSRSGVRYIRVVDMDPNDADCCKWTKIGIRELRVFSSEEEIAQVNPKWSWQYRITDLK